MPDEGESGFSLAEVLMSTIILSIAMAGVVTLFRASQTVHNTTQQGLELQQNVRAALSYMYREMINTGSGITYSSKLNGSPGIPIPLGALLGPMSTPVMGGSIYFITPGDGTGGSVTKDGEGNSLGTPIATDTITFMGGQGDVRFVNPNAPGPTASWGNQLYLEDNSIFSVGQCLLVTNGFQFALGQVTQILSSNGLGFSSGADPLGVNVAGSSGTPNAIYYAAQQAPGRPPALAFPLSSICYYIDATTDPPHPMLKRLANSAGGAAAGVAVANDIENLQAVYMVDHDGNATTPNITVTSPSVAQFPLIRGVEITLTGRSRVKMGDSHYPDLHTRLTMTQTVFFRNNIRR